MTEPSRTRRRFLVGTGIATTVALAGCSGAPNSEPDEQSTDENSTGGDDESHAESHDAALEGPSASATVTMVTTDDGTHFEPHVVWVEQGGTVTWELESGSHTTTAYAADNDAPQRIPDDADAWDSGTISEAGGTFEHTFETTGVYDYFCVPHESTGMLGSVVVGEPDAQGQPGLQEPQDGLPGEAAGKVESLNGTVTDALGGSSEGGDDAGSEDEDGHDHTEDDH